MWKFFVISAILHCCIAQQYQQKVAPGVPPQQYQEQSGASSQNYQPPPPPAQPQQYQQQQYGQPQQQQQQFQQQQYQPPPQQQQQVPIQQVPVPQGHGHPHQGDPQLLNPGNMESEKDHIQEHMEVPMDISKMSQAELQFHYFKMHDSDHNNKLDGCELIKSLIHWHGKIDKNHKVYTDDQLETILEYALTNVDLNEDGFVDYMEYRLSNYKGQKARDAKAHNEGKKIAEAKAYTDEQLVEIVDTAMKEVDANDDGYIDFAEYKLKMS